MQDAHELTDGEVIAIECKTLRVSYNGEDRNSTIYVVKAFATGKRMVLGQVRTDENPTRVRRGHGNQKVKMIFCG